jgi:hypothetical protein
LLIAELPEPSSEASMTSPRANGVTLSATQDLFALLSKLNMLQYRHILHHLQLATPSKVATSSIDLLQQHGIPNEEATKLVQFAQGKLPDGTLPLPATRHHALNVFILL